MKLIGIIKTIGPAFATIAPGLVASDWLIGIIGAVIIRLVVYCKVKNAKKFQISRLPFSLLPFFLYLCSIKQ